MKKNTENNKDSNSHAFIIGDVDKGLTIVITDPVMVAHYTKEELMSEEFSELHGADPLTSMAAIVRHLLPHLRGVEVPDLQRAFQSIVGGDGVKSNEELLEAKEVFDEISYSRTIAQLIKSKGNVCDVDFCLALDIDPCLIANRGRVLQPASEIGEYLERYGDCDSSVDSMVPAKPQKFKIGPLRTENLEKIKPWTAD